MNYPFTHPKSVTIHSKTGQITLIGELSNSLNLSDTVNQQQRFNDLETLGSFGEWLKWRRKAFDLTREELAERAGCSTFALRKIESGEGRPSKQLAGLLAYALEFTAEEQPTFIRVARGDINLERLRISKPDTSPPPFRIL